MVVALELKVEKMEMNKAAYVILKVPEYHLLEKKGGEVRSPSPTLMREELGLQLELLGNHH